jgi:hypothetical protein
MEIQQQELALAQKKIEEKSRVGGLRLEEDAAVAVAKPQAIDKELSLEDHQDPEHFDLPQYDPAERVQNYIYSQRFEESNTLVPPFLIMLSVHDSHRIPTILYEKNHPTED